MITRFPPAGQWPISVLQKWYRENLAESGKQATADWTSCTLRKWESLILYVGRVFHMQCSISHGTKSDPGLTQTHSAPFLHVFLLPLTVSPFPQLWRESWWKFCFLSPSDKLQISHQCWYWRHSSFFFFIMKYVFLPLSSPDLNLSSCLSLNVFVNWAAIYEALKLI